MTIVKFCEYIFEKESSEMNLPEFILNPLTDTALSFLFCAGSFKSQRGGISQFIIPDEAVLNCCFNLAEQLFSNTGSVEEEFIRIG